MYFKLKRECVSACSITIQTLDAVLVLYKWSVCASSQYDQTLLFFFLDISTEKGIHT